jgi:release factor glutamine methyltransferase
MATEPPARWAIAHAAFMLQKGPGGKLILQTHPMPTVLDVLQKTTDFLARKEIPQARLEAELLLAGALNCRKLDLYLRFEQLLTEDQLAPLRDQVARRGRHEPRQYISGRAGFLDFEVACDRRALIPRPETEELAELIFSRVTTPPTAALDLGTGTGVLALAVARRWPTCRVLAIDAGEETLALAKSNAATLGLAEQITFSCARWPDCFAKLGTFGVVAANPPYLSEEEWATAAPEVRDWEPRAALVAGEQGLADLRTILQTAPAILDSGGLLALETGIAHHAELTTIATSVNLGGQPAYARTESARDLSRRDRFFLAWRT